MTFVGLYRSFYYLFVSAHLPLLRGRDGCDCGRVHPIAHGVSFLKFFVRAAVLCGKPHLY